jgi:hypothetical protein
MDLDILIAEWRGRRDAHERRILADGLTLEHARERLAIERESHGLNQLVRQFWRALVLRFDPEARARAVYSFSPQVTCRRWPWGWVVEDVSGYRSADQICRVSQAGTSADDALRRTLDRQIGRMDLDGIAYAPPEVARVGVPGIPMRWCVDAWKRVESR